MEKATTRLRQLLKRDGMLYLPAVYYPLGGRMVERLGFEGAYVGGFVTGGSRAVSEPLLTLTEQVETASQIARSVSLPVIADAGAGFGEPLHVTRTVREFIDGGVAGIHIEDQLFPKRAHYHKYVAHAIPMDEYRDKIRWACRERDKRDPDFVIIGRTDVCRFEGLEASLERMEVAAEEGADMGMFFPRNDEEAKAAAKRSPLPLAYVQSRGNRDGRPLYAMNELEDMGYAMCIDAQLYLLASFHAAQKALVEMKQTGRYTGMTEEEAVTARQEIEDAIGLDEYYAIEAETVEGKE